MRVCQKCSDAKPIDQFGDDTRYADGKSRRCLSCKAKSEERRQRRKQLSRNVSGWRGPVGRINLPGDGYRE